MLGEGREAPIGAIPDDRPEARQAVDPLAQELAAATASCGRAEQAAAATVKPRISRRAASASYRSSGPHACRPRGRSGHSGRLSRCASTMIDGKSSRSRRTRTIAARRVIAAAQTPNARKRRHWAQTVHAP